MELLLPCLSYTEEPRSPILSCHFSLPEPINTFHGIHQNEDEPIRVSYHRNIHYNSVVNPNKATIGVGLGLPSFKPGVSFSWSTSGGGRRRLFRMGKRLVANILFHSRASRTGLLAALLSRIIERNVATARLWKIGAKRKFYRSGGVRRNLQWVL